MKPTPTHQKNATFFTALSHKRRQMLCEILLLSGAKGMPFGVLQNQSGLKVSTLTHHLRFMDQSGILLKRQKGNENWISIDLVRLRDLTRDFGGFISAITAKLPNQS